MTEERMTNEEAYKILKNSECFGAVELYYKDEIEAFNVALEALKAEPCERCVSIDAVMQTLTELGYGDEENGADAEYMSALWDVAKEIEPLPPVTPKQRTGKWKVIEVLHGEWEGTKKYACDKCGEKVGVFKSNYCPNCGAKMEGESE